MSVKDIIDQTDFTDKQKAEIVENIEASSFYVAHDIDFDGFDNQYIAEDKIGEAVAQVIVDENVSYDKAVIISQFDTPISLSSFNDALNEGQIIYDMKESCNFNSSDVEILSRAISLDFSPDQLYAVLSANTTETREVAANIIGEARVSINEDNQIDTAGIDKAEFVTGRLEQGSIDPILEQFGVKTEGVDNSQLSRVANDLYDGSYFDNKDIDKIEVAEKVTDIMSDISSYPINASDIANIFITGKVLGEKTEDIEAKITSELHNIDYSDCYNENDYNYAEFEAIDNLSVEYIEKAIEEYGIEIEKDEDGNPDTHKAMSVISLIYSHEDKAEEIVEKYNSGMSVDEIKETIDYDIYKDLDTNGLEYEVEVLDEQINIEIDTGNGYKVGILDEGGDGYVKVIILDEDGDPVYDTGIADDVVICSPSDAVDFCKEVAELPSVVDNDSDNVDDTDETDFVEDTEEPVSISEYIEGMKEEIGEINDKIEGLQAQLKPGVSDEVLQEYKDAVQEKADILDEHQEKLETALEEAKEAEDEDSINEIESGLDFISSERGEDDNDPATGD